MTRATLRFTSLFAVLMAFALPNTAADATARVGRTGQFGRQTAEKKATNVSLGAKCSKAGQRGKTRARANAVCRTKNGVLRWVRASAAIRSCANVQGATNYSVWVTDTSKPAPRKILQNQGEVDVDWADDPSTVAVLSGGTICITDVPRGTTASLVTVPGAFQFDWSPDGSSFVLRTAGPTEGTTDLRVVKVDGTGLKRLASIGASTSGGYSYNLAWSPDGHRIAFTVPGATGNGDTQVMQADGSGRHTVCESDGPEIEPSWSPDGRKLAIWQGGPIEVCKADGSRGPWVQCGGYVAAGSGVDWSPDGSRIALSGDGDIGTIEFPAGFTSCDDVPFKTLVATDGYDSDPKWSPNGRFIGFLVAEARGFGNLHVARSDGAGAHLVAKQVQSFSWSPDSKTVVYVTVGGG